ncbi:MAG: hypothetical protein JXA78_10635 [Anaerolineales bacterium]|nr:hypothetical protein [Anaerolineales bacterium]
MTNLLVSSIRRHCPSGEPSGYIYTINLEEGKVLQRSDIIEPAYREVDDNPRGGLRGAKGIAVREDQIAIANFSMVFRYDPDWNLLGVITHPSCAAIHDILYQDDTIWVTAARTDMLMQFDLDGNLLRYYYLRDPSPILSTLGWNPPRLIDARQIRVGKTDFRNPQTHVKETFDRAHVNSVCVTPGAGDILVSLGFIFGSDYAKFIRLKIWLMKMGVWSKMTSMNRKIRSLLGQREKNTDNTLVVKPAKAQSAVIRISPDGSRSIGLIIPGVAAPSHSLLALSDDTAVYLNTTEGSVIHFDSRTGKIFSSTKVTDGFLRGMTKIDDRTILIGSLCELMIFDLSTHRVASSIQFTQDLKESIYDIKVLPPHYALPPSSFAEHFSKTTGYRDTVALMKDGHKSGQLVKPGLAGAGKL